ncbi:MAG: prephenate dehydrogenase [Lachnospiraceae bacterium]|nr:prephenate dehydrogenase [Lachnospiraceae bacterium]
MENRSYKKAGFLGLGLIGGSIAKAIKKYHPDVKLIANASSESTISLAFSDGVIENDTLLPLSEFSSCDIVFLCAPVDVNQRYMKELKEVLKKDTLLTDVGSVKTPITQAFEESGLSCSFIGGHPMTGKEKGGYDNSDPLLLENAYYVLTPSSHSDEDSVSRFSSFIKSLGSNTVVMDTVNHDRSVAAVSHVPHIIASSLVRLLINNDDTEEHMKLIAAGGFRDITRIASSDPNLWKSIFLENRDAVLSILDRFSSEVSEYRRALLDSDGEALHDMFLESRDYRDSMQIKKKGALTESYEFYVDIEDEPGALATIALILSNHDISIKNIGIVHNREFESGVLRIETYDDNAMELASSLLTKKGYNIHRRK